MNQKALTQIAFSLGIIAIVFSAVILGSTRTLQAILVPTETVTASK